MNKQLRRDAVRGVGWSFIGSISSRIFQVITTFMLAKLLVPADFGVFALASIVINALAIVSDIGFAQVLIYLKGDIERSANKAFILSIATSTALAAILFFSVNSIGSIFGVPAICWPMRVMALSLIVSGSASVPSVILDRGLKFKKKTMSEVPGAFIYAVVSISLAAMGVGVWSLVVGWCSMVIVDVGITWAICSWRPKWEFHVEECKAIINYGKHLVVSIAVAFIFVQIDKAAIGKWLGVSALGAYSIAFTICNLPVTNLTAVINRVMYPAFSKLADITEVRDMYLQVLRPLSVIAFPCAAALMILAGPLLRVLYGSKWEQAIPLFPMLALYGLIRAIGTTTDSVFMATGNATLMRRMNLIQLLIGGILVYPAAKYFGTEGVAYLFTGSAFVGTAYALTRAGRLLQMTARSLLRVMGPPGVAGILSAWLGLAVSSEPSWFEIGKLSLVFGCSYAIGVYLLDRSVYADIIAGIRKHRLGLDIIG